MNSTDGSWLALRTRARMARPDGQTLVAYLRGRIGDVAREGWQKFRADSILHTAILWGLGAWLVLELLFVAWAHYACEGDTHRAFLSGTMFGIPEREAAAGMQDVCRGGYDGQQYYWMSNDVFARHDAYKHLDAYLYRYQRIGIPMLAGSLATLMGYELTPPLLYHTVQFGITAAGFAALVYWLKLKGLHPAYALGWLISAGTLQSLWLGILDAPADAVFIFAFFAVMTRRLWLYVPLATLLLLIREGYCVYAFAVFMATVLGRVAWQDSNGQWQPFARVAWREASGYWNRVVLTAIPGIVMLAWTAYLSLRFQLRPLAHHNNPNATSWPYKAMIKCTEMFWRTSNWYELRLAMVSAFTLILVSVLLVHNRKRLPLALACSLPYVLLVATFGKMVWEASNGHLKSNGTIILLGLFLLPIDKSILLRFMLGLQAAVGINLEAENRLMSPTILAEAFMAEASLTEAPGYPAHSPDAPDNAVLIDLRSSVEWLDPKSVCVRKYDGIFNRVHRELQPMLVAVTNHSNVTWQPGKGKHPLWLGYTLYDGSGEKQLCQHSVMLDRPIGPGETGQFLTYLELRRPHRNYVVEFTMWQDGPGWFAKSDPTFGHRYEFTVE